MASIWDYLTAESGNEAGAEGIISVETVHDIPTTLIAGMRSQFTPPTSGWIIHPNYSGMLAPRLNSYRLEKGRSTAQRRVTCGWRTPPLTAFVDQNRAVLEVDITGQFQKLASEISDEVSVKNIIEGQANSKTQAGMIWKVVAGTNECPLPRTTMRLITASESPRVANIMAMVGRVNHARLPNFGNAPAGTVLLAGATLRRQLKTNSALWDETYLFLYDPDGFACWSQAFIQSAVKVARKYLVETTGDASATYPIGSLKPDPAGGTETITMLAPVIDTNTKGPKPAEKRDTTRGKADFSKLDAKLTWLSRKGV